MCWVMPPASRAVTFVARIASRRLVLPWSTCPRTVMTGGRSLSFAGSTSSQRICFLLGALLEAELVRDESRGLEVDRLVDRHHRPHVHEPADDVDDAHVEGASKIADDDRLRQGHHGRCLGDRDGRHRLRHRLRHGGTLRPAPSRARAALRWHPPGSCFRHLVSVLWPPPRARLAAGRRSLGRYQFLTLSPMRPPRARARDTRGRGRGTPRVRRPSRGGPRKALPWVSVRRAPTLVWRGPSGRRRKSAAEDSAAAGAPP